MVKTVGYMGLIKLQALNPMSSLYFITEIIEKSVLGYFFLFIQRMGQLSVRHMNLLSISYKFYFAQIAFSLRQMHLKLSFLSSVVYLFFYNLRIAT